MSDRARQELLGYLLGALDDSETEALEVRLQGDPELRRQLARARRELQSVDSVQHEDDPPPGLARRTCDFVFSHARRLQPRPPKPRIPETAPLGREGRVGWLDIAVATSVLALAGMVILPAVNGSRFQARILSCQNNLRQLGISLNQYSDRNGGYYPRVPTEGRMAVAGVYAPTLVSSGLLTDSRQVICPDSALAAQRDLLVPSLDELRAATEQRAARLRRLMGGSYGYCIGHVEGGVFVPTRNLSRDHFAVMSDAPSETSPEHQTLNHGGRGQNVLFEDGHVVFLTSSQPCDSSDDFFSNDHHMVAAGDHPEDSVIASSGTTPTIYVSYP